VPDQAPSKPANGLPDWACAAESDNVKAAPMPAALTPRANRAEPNSFISGFHLSKIDASYIRGVRAASKV
jgi:hypothetical protein